MMTAQAADPEMFDEALEILELVRSLAPDDPLAEALAVHLLQSGKSAIGRDAAAASVAARRATQVASSAGTAGIA